MNGLSASTSSDAKPVAAELHVHPLACGFVDASDTGAGTLMVMGQTVQITSSTVFSDHRSCVSATVAPCSAVAGQQDLSATTGSGAGAAVLQPWWLKSATVAAGDAVLVLGTYASGTLTVGPVPSRHNVVIDFGVPREPDHRGF